MFHRLVARVVPSPLGRPASLREDDLKREKKSYKTSKSLSLWVSQTEEKEITWKRWRKQQKNRTSEGAALGGIRTRVVAILWSRGVVIL